MASILIVDDEIAILRVIRLTLQSVGHEVVQAVNGREALKLFSGQSFDLVITDIVMPDTEGMETIIEMRKVSPTVKIIAISGGGTYDQGNYLKMAMLLGADRCLDKPFGMEELVHLVDELLAG